MKKLSVLFLSLVALVSVVSCNNDDDDSSTSASIEGKWQLSKEGESQNALQAVENEGNCGTSTVEIKSNNTFTETDYYFTDACQQYTGGGTWEKINNTLKVTQDGETSTIEIVELTATTLITKEVDEEGTWYLLYVRK